MNYYLINPNWINAIKEYCDYYNINEELDKEVNNKNINAGNCFSNIDNIIDSYLKKYDLIFEKNNFFLNLTNIQLIN